MKQTKLLTALLLAVSIPLLPLTLAGCGKAAPAVNPSVTGAEEGAGKGWTLGYASLPIEIPETDGPLYIAGYNSGWEITEVRDLPHATAVWMDAGGSGILVISVDCVGLGSPTVKEIRSRLADFCNDRSCAAVNVVATHSHAGVDTFGLWGPTAEEGKNPEFMEAVISACVKSAGEAYNDRRPGRLFYGEAQTHELLRDSRDPQVTDEILHQFRFAPDDGSQGIRAVIFGAHAESLRGANTRLSRDYPGVMGDLITEESGDRVLFLPGAVGGLVMTREFVADPFDAEENLLITGRALADAALSVDPSAEEELIPTLRSATVPLSVPLDNTAFEYYKFLGILKNESPKGSGETGYDLLSELTVLEAGGLPLALIPGEIFPELVFGGYLTEETGAACNTAVKYENPVPLKEIAAQFGYERLLPVGLANDELGYIVPPNDFYLNESAPYLDKAYDESGRRHYEETNCVGPRTASVIADGFRAALEKLSETPESGNGK